MISKKFLARVRWENPKMREPKDFVPLFGLASGLQSPLVGFLGLLFFGSFNFVELVRLKPSSVLLEEQKKGTNKTRIIFKTQKNKTHLKTTIMNTFNKKLILSESNETVGA
jgi:hypothetical protein